MAEATVGPIQITIEVKGLEEMLARFDRADEIVSKAADKALLGMARDLQAEVTGYGSTDPPLREGQSYVRTFTLARSFHAESFPGQYKALTGSIAHYSPYVLDANKQAWMHKGRWYTVQSKADELAAVFDEWLAAAGDEIVDGLSSG